VPTVYREPYEYSVPGEVNDFHPQNLSDEEVRRTTGQDKEKH
jgi:hypothetical protein